MALILMTIVHHLSIKNLLVQRTTYTENLSRPQTVLVVSGDRTSRNVDACLPILELLPFFHQIFKKLILFILYFKNYKR